MAKKEYAFYPGCSSQLKASASNYLVSTNSMCEKLDIKLTEIPDWNCCGASVGYCEGGELPRIAINARNFAQAETHLPGQDIVATCAACWLGARESKERLDGSAQLMKETNEALAAAGLHYSGGANVRHMVEVLIEDFGYDGLKAPMKKSLEGIKFAGYVGCQTNRPFGIVGESFENPLYLDKMVETFGGEALDQLRPEGHLLRRRAGVFRAGEKPEADSRHRRIGLRRRRRDDRHALPAVPGQRRGVSVGNQQEAGHQVQHAGALLLAADDHRLRRQRPRMPASTAS